MRVERQIIKIDEDKCDGCGQCAEACHEGAIQIIDGKARLISDSYCDGLGDCIGKCPQGAISFETRQADPYDDEMVKARSGREEETNSRCPGSILMDMNNVKTVSSDDISFKENMLFQHSLVNWPVQLKLLPENAPFLKNSHLVIGADCTAFAYEGFLGEFLSGENKVCVIGCPKLDDRKFYREKLARIIGFNEISSITVVFMEVPCCGGMVNLVKNAIEDNFSDTDLRLVKIAIKGNKINDETIRYRFRAKAGYTE